MENPLRVSPVPSPPLSSSSPSSSGLRRSSTSWTLSSMAHMLAEQQQQLQQQADADDDAVRAKRSVPMRKPPRHSSVPMCAQILLALWQRELQRADVAITSDFFFDLAGSNEQAVFLVDRMQRMGFNISLQQFISLPRCSIYSVLLVAL